MSRPLQIRQKQVTAICRGAEKAGFVPVIEIDGVVVRLIPEQRYTPTVDSNSENPSFDTLAEYLAWRDGRGQRDD